MDGGTLAAAITALATIFGGFYGLMRYIVGQQQKSNETFMTYIKEKNGHNERIAADFSKRIEDSHDVLRGLTTQIERLTSSKARR